MKRGVKKDFQRIRWWTRCHTTTSMDQGITMINPMMVAMSTVAYPSDILTRDMSDYILNFIRGWTAFPMFYRCVQLNGR